MYRLKYDIAAGTEAVHDALPQHAGEQLTLALADACHDPLGATHPYGEDDDYMRMVIIDHATAVILLGHQTKTLLVLEITYLG